MKLRRALRGRTKSRGQSLVEFALLLPIGLIMLTGAFDLARIRQFQASLTHAAQRGADFATKVSKNLETPTEAEVREVVRKNLAPPVRSEDVRDEDILIDLKKVVAGQESAFIRINARIEPFLFKWYGDSGTSSYPVSGKALLPLQEVTVASFEATEPPLFEINDDQTITTLSTTVNSYILGADFGSSDGSLAAVYAAFSKNGGEDWENLNNGRRCNPRHVNERASWIHPDEDITGVDPDDVIVFKGWSPDGYVGEVQSTQKPQVLVLKNGDPAPEFSPGYAVQESAMALVGEYVDWETNCIKLADDQAIVLWDFNDLSGSGVDYNDLAMVVTFTDTES